MSWSIATIGAITFVGDSSRGILFPVLWSLCQRLHGTVVDLGYLVAMFSLGRFVVTIPLGYLSDIYQQKLPLLVACITLTIGAIIWANTYVTSALACLYFAQFVMGCGSGSLAVTRSYVVEQSVPAARTEVYTHTNLYLISFINQTCTC